MTRKRSVFADWIDWFIETKDGEISGRDEPRTRVYKGAYLSSATRHLLALARVRGVLSEEHWKIVEDWGGKDANKRRVVVNSVCESLLCMSLDDALMQCNWIDDREAHRALANWADVEAKREIGCTRGLYNTPCPFRVSGKVESTTETPKQFKKKERSPSLFDLLFTPLDEVIQRVEVQVESQPLPDGANLADLVEFALNYDLGLLE